MKREAKNLALGCGELQEYYCLIYWGHGCAAVHEEGGGWRGGRTFSQRNIRQPEYSREIWRERETHLPSMQGSPFPYTAPGVQGFLY